MDELRDEWDLLAQRLGAPPFARPAWILAWQRHLEPHSVVELVVARNPDGDLAGVLPLVRTSRRLHSRIPVRVSYLAVAGAGTGAADHVGPLAATDEVGRALVGAALDLARRTTLYLENLSPRWADLVERHFGGRVTRLTECPAASRSAEGRFEEGWSKKSAKNIRRRQRLLADEGVLARWVPAGPDFDDALDVLRSVHNLRWAAQGGDGKLEPQRMDFLRTLARESREPDVPWILLLEQGDVPVAAMLGLVAGTSFSVYKTGWNPEFAHLSPGVLMGATAMEWSEQHGLEVFDYLRGPRGHKRDLGCENVVDRSVVFPVGLRGAVLEQRERFAADGVRPAWWERVQRLRPAATGAE